jgi:vacuolar-type H+-ATPase subunit E/Vma4
MKAETGSAPEHEIVEKILADAQSQAQQAIGNAGKVAEAEAEKARKEGQKIQAEILAQAEDKVEKLKLREVSTANIEAKRIALTAREKAISKVFAQIEQELEDIKKDPDQYRRSLGNLAADAILGVGEPEVVLKVSRADKALVDDAFIDDVRRRVSERSGAQPKVDVEFEPADMGGGCVARSKEGRIVFDNTFRRRLGNMRPRLRSLIVKELMNTNE